MTYVKHTWQNGEVITADKLNYIESGIEAVDSTAYTKPSGGIPKSDLASVVRASLEKADESIAAPASPASGAFLVWNGSAWVAQAGSGTGLSDEAKTALLNCFAHVAWTDEHGQDYYDALESALYPPANLVSISAVYTQSGTVYDTDTLDSLKTDLVVTAVYSDSTTEVVTSYTLSGTLVEGTSTITVSYGGKTATFTVTVTASGVTNPYHSDDMTLWLDGIYNTSTGHDSTATSWEDLIGNILFENNGITIDSDGMTFDGTAGHGFIGTAPTSPKTIEVVMSVSNPSTTQAVINGFGNADAGNVSVKGGALLEKRGNYQSLGKNCQAISNGTHTYTFIDGVGQYIDGVSASVATQNISMTNSGVMAIGNAITNNGALATGSAGYPLTGKIHCIRFYSDELTSMEIASNAAVDATRFNMS